jgi:hypothetical protein
MIPIILSIGFVFLAAFFNAVMDATENEPNFNESILKNLNRKFWLKSVSCDFVKTTLGYRPDAWHLAKTSMVFCFTGALISAVFVGVYLAANPSFWLISASIGVIGVSWNASFNLFYNLIFKIK